VTGKPTPKEFFAIVLLIPHWGYAHGMRSEKNVVKNTTEKMETESLFINGGGGARTRPERREKQRINTGIEQD